MSYIVQATVAIELRYSWGKLSGQVRLLLTSKVYANLVKRTSTLLKPRHLSARRVKECTRQVKVCTRQEFENTRE